MTCLEYYVVLFRVVFRYCFSKLQAVQRAERQDHCRSARSALGSSRSSADRVRDQPAAMSLPFPDATSDQAGRGEVSNKSAALLPSNEPVGSSVLGVTTATSSWADGTQGPGPSSLPNSASFGGMVERQPLFPKMSDHVLDQQHNMGTLLRMASQEPAAASADPPTVGPRTSELGAYLTLSDEGEGPRVACAFFKRTGLFVGWAAGCRVLMRPPWISHPTLSSIDLRYLCLR